MIHEKTAIAPHFGERAAPLCSAFGDRRKVQFGRLSGGPESGLMVFRRAKTVCQNGLVGFLLYEYAVVRAYAGATKLLNEWRLYISAALMTQ